MEIITSRQNALCTHLRKLAASASYRRKSGEFLCDSPKLLEEALLWGGDLHTVVCTEHAALPVIPHGVRLVQVPEVAVPQCPVISGLQHKPRWLFLQADLMWTVRSWFQEL